MSVITSALFFVLIWASETTKASPTYDYIELTNNNSDPFNPGPCNAQSHGQIKLVKDRNEEDRVVVCTEHDNSASWKFLDGSSTVGEFFDPAYDCSYVVDRVAAPKDGLYWIKNKAVNKVVKVWCDVTTDGGGYMLVAKKDGPVTWTVPSSNETVHPHGDPHWYSTFGGINMLDIRFQFSTTTKFVDTKADWSFRLRNKRPFGKLLVRDYGGCTEHNPGIGDIAYVKDLLVGKVVNTHFRCSLFSAHLSDKIGWGMMNRCLQMPCPDGFAIVKLGYGGSINLDDHGSFSYSIHRNATRSGILHSSTAFIGCSDGKCCACYGPKGGKKNYCLNNCTAINGGTVTKNVWTWIWIRSSVPKRVWRKCTEITKTDSRGEKQTYRINEETGIEEKGSCTYSEEVKKSGSVLVAPNAKAMKKIPPAPGLLLYRSNDKKFFIQEEKKWNEIAMKKEVKSEKQLEQTFLQKLMDTERKLEKKITDAQQLVEQKFKQKLNDTEQKLENQIKIEQQLVERKLEKKLKNAQQSLEDQISSLRNETIFHQTDGSCRSLKLRVSSLANGIYPIDSNYQAYCDMINGGWTLIARFSNADSKSWMINGNFWYDRVLPYDHPTRPFHNRDMISKAFWKVKANEFKITRSDDSSHTALLQTTSNCLQGRTFRSKITSYGDFRNGAVWASDQCRGSCSVTYGGQYQSTAGFEKHSCSSDIQSSNYIGFWCDWDSGDGAVMMIGGGGSRCERADHGIGVTEHDEAKFGPGNEHHDFGNINNFKPYAPTTYSLNLWVR